MLLHGCTFKLVAILPWAELSYNTTFHTSNGYPQFQIVYDWLSPSLSDYSPNSSSIEAVDTWFIERDEVLGQLKQNLSNMQNRMKQQVDEHRRDVEFTIGDHVLVKLQSYRQVSLRKN